MASVITLEGLTSFSGTNEDRALALIKIDYNSNIYDWKIYIPTTVTDIGTFLENSKPALELEIDLKEAEWTALDPKTREIPDPFNPGQTIVVPILKEEIVKPEVPDVRARRRDSYPSLHSQVEALWKGVNAAEYAEVETQIDDVDNAIDEKYRSAAELTARKIERYRQRIQKNLDKFAANKEPFIDMADACIYSLCTTVNLYQTRGQYCVNARADMWKAFYDIVKDVNDGIRTLPETWSELNLELPQLSWP